MANSERLEQLAQRVEQYKDFNQVYNDTCVIRLAELMIDEDEGVCYWAERWKERIARYFGISGDDAVNILIADYPALNIDFPSYRDRMEDVTRETAAAAVRALAARG